MPNETKSAWPEIDPRVKAVGVSKLREMNAAFLRDLGDAAYLIHDGYDPVAVLVSYEAYVQAVKQLKESSDAN